MGFGYIILSFFFLFNPLWNIFDVLPDFIGCMFLLKGLSKLADINSTLSVSKEKFSKLLWVYIAKFVIMLMFVLFDQTWILVWTFSFAVLELI